VSGCSPVIGTIAVKSWAALVWMAAEVLAPARLGSVEYCTATLAAASVRAQTSAAVAVTPPTSGPLVIAAGTARSSRAWTVSCQRECERSVRRRFGRDVAQCLRGHHPDAIGAPCDCTNRK